MKRWLAYGLIFFLLLGALAWSLFWMLGTPGGAQWLLGAVSRWTQVKINAEKVTGRIADELRLEGVKVHWPEGEMKIENLRLRWQPSRLLVGRVSFHDLSLRGVEIQDYRPESETPTDLTLPRIHGLPAGLALEVGAFQGENLVYRRLDHPPLRVDRLLAQVSWGQGILGVERFVLETPLGRGEGSGELSFLKPAFKLNVVLSPRETIIGLDRFSFNAKLQHGQKPEEMVGSAVLTGNSGPVERLLLKGELALTSSRIFLRRFLLLQPGQAGSVAGDGQVDFSGMKPILKVALKLKDVDLSKELALPAIVSGEVAAEGDPSGYGGRFTLENPSKDWQRVHLSGTFQGNLDGIKASVHEGNLLQGSLTGQLGAAWREGLSIEVKLRGRDLDPSRITPEWQGRINLDLEGQLRWSEGTLLGGRLSGRLLESELRGKALTGRIDARVDKGVLRLTEADLRGKGFDLHAQGVLQEQLTYDARVTDLSGLVPGAKGSFSAKGWVRWRNDQLSGSLTGEGQDLVSGGVKMGTANVTARLEEGERGVVNLRAQIHRLAYDFIQADSASLNVAGKVNDHRIEIAVRWPEGDAKGTFTGRYANEAWEGTVVRLSGTYPRGRSWDMTSPSPLTVSTDKLRLGPTALASVTGEKIQVDADLFLRPISGFLHTEWDGVDAGRVNPWLKSPHLAGKTTGKLNIQWLGNDRIRLTAAVNMVGSIRDPSMKVEMSPVELNLDWDEKGLQSRWKVELVQGGRAEGEFSSSQPARMAFPEEGRLNLNWQAVDLVLLKPWIPQDLTMEGRLSGRLSGQWLRGRRFDTEGEATISRGTLKWKTKEGPVNSSLREASASWSWSNDELRGTFALGLAEYGEIKGKFELPLAAQLPLAFRKTGSLRVSLDGQLQEKGLLASFFPGLIQESRGEIGLKLDARGTWENPRVDGDLQLKKAVFQLSTGQSSRKEKDLPQRAAPTPGEARSVRVELSRGLGTLSWNEKGLLTSWQIELVDGGKLRGKLSSPHPGRLIFPERGVMEARWEGVSLGLLRSWLPSPVLLEGRLEGQMDGKWMPGPHLDVKGNAKILQGAVTWRGERGEIGANLKKAEARLVWHEEALQGDVSLDLERYGHLEGDFKLPLPARLPIALQGKGPVQLALRGQVQEMGLLSTLFPGLVQESQGDVGLTLGARGTWEKPQLEGSLQLSKAGAYLPGAGIRLEDVRVEGKFAEDQLRITSFRMRSGPGQVEGTGTVWMKAGKISRYQGTLKGERFQTIYLPELQVLSNPRLDFEGTPEKLMVRGEIQLPEALILSTETKGEIRPSPDVVIVDEAKGSKPSVAFPLDAQVRLLLGEKVQVKAGGIDTKLSGSLSLKIRNAREVTASGEIQVAQGTYTYYGKKLDITRGRLIFNGPLDNPTLDVLALRKVSGVLGWEERAKEVQAGVVLTGPIQSPLIRLYSQPPMPEADILSYLITGQPIAKGGKADLSTLAVSAADFLFSKEGSAGVQNQLLGKLGIENLDIQTIQTGETPQTGQTSLTGLTGQTGQKSPGAISRSLVTVGKYLNPRLYVGLGSSLFATTPSYQVFLRYSLTGNVDIETKTGTQSGVSIYYKIRFD